MKKKKSIALAVLLLAPAAAVASCSNDDNPIVTLQIDGSVLDVVVPDVFVDGPFVDGTVQIAVPRDGGDAALVDAASLSDAQIVGVVTAANTGEIEEALLATGFPDMLFDGGLDGGLDGVQDGGFDAGTARTTTPAVLAFAEMMITDHAHANVAVDALAIAPQASPVQATLQSSVQTTLGQLSSLSGPAFDVAYVQSQVTAHQTVLDLLQNQLIPQAQSAALKSLLQSSVLPTVQAHLAAARALLAQLTDAGVVDAGGGG
jgi:putative membrane protein